MGRPSALTQDVREKVEAALARGFPIAAAASAAGVSERSVKRWLGSGKVVRRQLSAAPEPEPQQGPSEGDVERALVLRIMAASKTDWRAAAFLLRWREQRRRSHR